MPIYRPGGAWDAVSVFVAVIVVIILLWFVLRVLFPAMGINF